MVARKPIELTLPFPPSLNSMWRQFRGRAILSAKGRAFRADAMAAIWNQIGKPKPLTGRLAVEIVLIRGDKRSFDIDNSPKSVLDSLTHAGVIQDDSQIDVLTIRRGAVMPKQGKACVYIRELSDVCGEE